jgi:hypothetical protein
MKITRNPKTQLVHARRVLRCEVDWVTRYMLEGNREQVWRECRVRDLSRGGAGVELSDTTEDKARGHRVILELEVPPAVLHLRGEVRHAGPGSDGGIHVGLRFASLTALECDMLDSLLERETTR